MRELFEKDAIKNLQTYLRYQRALDGSALSLPVDGIFDDRTRLALSDFQLKNGLSPTGIADRETWDLLYSQYLDALDSLGLPGPVIPFPSYPNDYRIRLGERSFLVAVLQFTLNEIEVVYNILDAIDIDGEYGEETRDAVILLQKIAGLPETGEVDRATWDHIVKIYNLSMHYIDRI